MPRTAKGTDEGAAPAAPESTTETAAPAAPESTTETAAPAAKPKPKAKPKQVGRVRALAHLRRAAGSVDANSEFTPVDEKERKFLLDNRYAEEV